MRRGLATVVRLSFLFGMSTLNHSSFSFPIGTAKSRTIEKRIRLGNWSVQSAIRTSVSFFGSSLVRMSALISSLLARKLAQDSKEYSRVHSYTYRRSTESRYLMQWESQFVNPKMCSHPLSIYAQPGSHVSPRRQPCQHWRPTSGRLDRT